LNRTRAGALLTILIGAVIASTGTRALQVVEASREASAIDLIEAVEWLRTENNRLNVLTARGRHGIARPMEARSREGSNTWVTFALSNPSDESVERLIVAPRCRSLGDLLWPDLGKSHVAAITADAGAPPEREESAVADVFRVTLNPGTVTTFVLEMRTEDLPELLLWEPGAYHGDRPIAPPAHSPIIDFIGLFALVISVLTL
jgi:hypothetical protein